MKDRVSVIVERIVAKILNYPHRVQGFDFDCGANSVMTVLHYYGKVVREQEVMDAAGTDKRGSTNEGIEKALKKFKMKFENVTDLKEINASIRKGFPVIVSLSLEKGLGHYVVVVGKESGNYIVSDSLSPNLSKVDIRRFSEFWMEEDGTRWGVSVAGTPKFKKDAIVPMEIVQRFDPQIEGKK
jgi:ABC-type bacteriocin/lantibiotic exporter with double-glycine peptidase domain